MKKELIKLRKPTTLVVIVSLIVTLLASIVIPQGMIKTKAATYGLNNPTTDAKGVTTWDTVYFGNYYQGDVTGKTKSLIRWRVLSVNGDDAFLLADQSLDCKQYNTETKNMTWETCSLRTWLNNTFLSTAFTSTEQSAIKNTTVVNDDNAKYNTEGGNNTVDKVYLLSTAEACNASYGFNAKFDSDSATRETKNTAYATKQGAWTSTDESYAGNGWWWLRTPGNISSKAAAALGHGFGDYGGNSVNYSSNAVRPVLHLNLSSANLWSNGGKVTSGKGSGTVTTPTSAAITTVPKKNATKTIGTLRYKVTKSAAKNGTVAVTGVKSKKVKSITIPATIKIKGYTFKVSAINAKAFMNCKKLTKLIVKSPYIKSVGKNAIKKANKKLVIKVPKKQYKKYKKLFVKKTGFKNSMKLKR